MATKKVKKRVLLILLVLLLAGTGVGFVVQKYFFASAIRHVVLISLDTCRADHLSCYGYDQQTTPNIDALAEQGFLFRHAISPVPLTLPAHTTMLTGTIPPHHGKHENEDGYFDPSHVTLAQLLKKKGFSTGAFVGAQVLNARLGLNRGFDTYQDKFAQPGPERRAEEVNREALAWLEQEKDNSVFLFLHYYDPHDKYSPPEPFAKNFEETPYAGEIAYVDHYIGQVVDELKRLGMYDSSLIIVTGDHGEMLGEHGELTHMFFVYQSALEVPLIFKLPGSQAAHQIEELAGIVDIVPTVCDLVGIDPPTGIQGKNLAGYFRNQPPPDEDRHLYCESLYPTKYGANSLLGLVSKQWKYIQTSRPELYDLQKDPQELNNLIETDPRRARLLRDRLAHLLEQTSRQEEGQEDAPLDTNILKQLRALGYLADNNVDEDFSFDQSKEDPKDLIEYHNEFRKAAHLLDESKAVDLAVLEKRMIERRPEIGDTYALLFAVALKQKDRKSAIRFGEKALELTPGRSKIHYHVGMVYFDSNQPEAAANHFELTLKFMPADPSIKQNIRLQVLNRLGLLRVNQQQFAPATVHLQESLKLNPKQPRILNALAWVRIACPDQSIKNPPQGLELARRACALTQSKHPEYLITLAVAYASVNNFPEAEKAAAKALAIARANGDQALEAKIKKHIDLFKLKVPSVR